MPDIHVLVLDPIGREQHYAYAKCTIVCFGLFSLFRVLFFLQLLYIFMGLRLRIRMGKKNVNLVRNNHWFEDAHKFIIA